jgi:S-DNA-T family DNA segregation ATPase FtsK/SpoIIIE
LLQKGFHPSPSHVYLGGVARKDSTRVAHARGWSDIIGLVMVALGVLLFIAQVSFDRHDLTTNRVPANETIHNWIGSVGAFIANGFFFLCGAGAYLLSILLVVFGAAHLLDSLAYLRRRWPWGLAMFLATLCFFDLYSANFETLKHNLNASSAGGLIGQTLNTLVFRHVGKPGATVLFILLYIVGLTFLINFRFMEWMRSLFEREPPEEKSLPPEEKALARRARELEREARQLQEQVQRSGIGADLQPVPAPTVRDLSVPQPRLAKTTRPKGRDAAPAGPAPASETPVTAEEKFGVEGEVISAREIGAATAADVLGRPSGAKPASTAVVPAESPKSEAVESAPVATAVAEPAPPAPKPADPVTINDNSGGRARRPAKKKPLAVASTPSIEKYQLPPMDLLAHPDTTIKPTESKEELMANARLMQQTLAQFDIEVSLGDITKGPTITRYELHPAPGVKLEKITGLTNNIAAALKAERIHVLAPVPGKSSVGIEVPNVIKTKVIMRDLLEAEEWGHTKARIPLALGKDVYGHPIIADLSEMPHLLIAGATGSGKSVCINSIIASLLYRFPPDQLRFVMIDPKVVELQQYNSLPHLVVPVVTDPKKVILALRWVVNEMEKRYQIFAKVGVRNIKSFNDRPKGKAAAPPPQPELPLTARKEKIEAGSDGFAVEVDEEIVVPRDEDIVIPEKLSYIVVIIDELADLMLVAPADVEMAIARITQMARAAGIHCLVATQRPSVDVITGVIKANIPARIAFQVASRVDSRTILDAMGADKLLGKGDMLYLPPGSAKLIRAQGALITDQEIQSIVDFIALQGKPSYELEIHEQLSKPGNDFENESGCDEDEKIIQQCIEVIRSEQKASVSLLQRRLRLGYGRAARIMDELENRGIVGPSNGAEPRDILIDLDGGGADGNPPPAS